MKQQDPNLADSVDVYYDTLLRTRNVRACRSGAKRTMFSKNGKSKTILKIGNHSNLDGFINWIENEDSVRKILSEWILPVLNTINDVNELNGKCLIKTTRIRLW